VNRFQKEGFQSRTIYDFINRMQHEEASMDKKKMGPQPSKKNQQKQLTQKEFWSEAKALSEDNWYIDKHKNEHFLF
jgi:hypothetical protein